MNNPFKKYRKQFREWKNKQRLKRELHYYSSKFDSLHLAFPNEETIRKAFKQKFPDLKPRQNGNLNVLAIYHHYNWENESLKPSLEKFGLVRHYDWFEQFNHQQKDWYNSIKAKRIQQMLFLPICQADLYLQIQFGN
jgi:hypothetical protein